MFNQLLLQGKFFGHAKEVQPIKQIWRCKYAPISGRKICKQWGLKICCWTAALYTFAEKCSWRQDELQRN